MKETEGWARLRSKGEVFLTKEAATETELSVALYEFCYLGWLWLKSKYSGGDKMAGDWCAREQRGIHNPTKISPNKE